MDENMRTYIWFLSVVLAMTIGPALLLTLFICGVATTWNRYRDAIVEHLKFRHAMVPARIHARMPAHSHH